MNPEEDSRARREPAVLTGSVAFRYCPPDSRWVGSELPVRVHVPAERREKPLSQLQRFHIRTYGCQMNAHDSEKVANLLYHAGWTAARGAEDAELLVINTCSIRDKAEHQLYSDLGLLRDWKAARPGRVLGVAGCVAQQEGDAIQRRFRHVDFVFGTHNLRLVPAMVAAAQQGRSSLEVGEKASPERFDLPERHPDYPGATPGRAYLTVMEGCDMFCTFCVVPGTRGREISRPAAGIIAEAESLADRGVLELTLLGQTVNAYGRHDRRRGRAGTLGFGALLRRLAEIPGIARLRYTSPHPLFFDHELVSAHAELEKLCPHIHLPLQSGSDPVLERMRRRYTADDYRARVAALRAARSDLVLTTDLIVGFPGESDDDFRRTLDLVAEVGFVDAYSFKYSPRPGTPAALLPGAVPGDVAQQRLEELQQLQRALTLAEHRRRVGDETLVLVTGESRRGGGQRSGRDPYHRVVNFSAPVGESEIGSLVPVRVVEATPHSLIAELRSAETGPGMRRSVKGGVGIADEQGLSA
jgi:tRNA-2-methylthio-N6-dimethylallyladenosine synthase